MSDIAQEQAVAPQRLSLKVVGLDDLQSPATCTTRDNRPITISCRFAESALTSDVLSSATLNILSKNLLAILIYWH